MLITQIDEFKCGGYVYEPHLRVSQSVSRVYRIPCLDRHSVSVRAGSGRILYVVLIQMRFVNE